MVQYNPSKKYQIVIIRVNQSVVYSNYLYLFPNNIQAHINSFFSYHDKLVAFTSAMLKYYYLPAILAIEPTEIQIEIDNYGKPYLLNYPAIDFNISHSGEYVVLAVAVGKKIGIDIELIDEHIDLTIKSIVFNECEERIINNYYDFFVLWSKKEAYLKCLGLGFNNKIYQHTKLNNQWLESFNQHEIITFNFEKDYILSICSS